MKKKLGFEIFVSGVVVFDILGYSAYHFAIWPFFPMWVGAMLEIEVGARVLAWSSKRVRFFRLQRPPKAPLPLSG